MENNNTESTKLIALSNENTEYKFTIKDNFEYSYKKQKLKLEVIEEADGFTIISVNGVRYPVEIVSRQQNVYEVLINGVSYTFSVETDFSLNRKKLLSSLTPSSKMEIVKAPMPGKILEVMVEPGQQVNRGEALLILEAMKMQNTITAHSKGIISKTTIKPGDTVGKNDLLIEIEKIS